MPNLNGISLSREAIKINPYIKIILISAYDKFEYGYAITTHSSQGSSWENVLYFHEPFLSGDDNKKLLYTGITRASKSVVIVI